MRVLSPISELTRGFKAYAQGALWLKSHPKYLMLVFIPMFVALLLLSFLWSSFIVYDDTVLQWILFAKPESWWGIALYYIARFFVYVSGLLLCLITCVLVASIVASPIYDIVSAAVEKDITGKKPPELSLWQSIKLIKEEIKKVLLILLVSVALLLIPGLNVLSLFVTAFLLGWDFFDYPLARRGWTVSQRFALVRRNLFAVIGFGVWMVIPFVHFFMMPLAVAGGTMLSVTALKNNNLNEKNVGEEHARS